MFQDDLSEIVLGKNKEEYKVLQMKSGHALCK